jgi:hypothetical protein
MVWGHLAFDHAFEIDRFFNNDGAFNHHLLRRWLSRPALDGQPCTAQSIAFAVHQSVYRGDQLHILRAIEPPSASAFDRVERGELLFPIAQHMGAQTKNRRYLANGAKGIGRFPVIKQDAGFAHGWAAGALGSGNTVLKHLAGAEGEHAAGRDRHLDAGLGIAANAFRFVTQEEGSKAGYLDVLAIGQSIRHQIEDRFDHRERIRAG